MRKLLWTIVIASGLLFGVAAPASADTFFAFLTGAQQNPAVPTTAKGYARVVLNEAAGTLNFLVVFNGLTSAQILAHIHQAAIGADGPVIIDFGTVGGTSGVISGTRSITPAQIAAMRAHGCYVNVHSANFSAGEIRGQLGLNRPLDFDGDGKSDYSVLRFPNVSPPGAAPITYHNLNSTAGYQAQPFGNANTDFPAPGDYDGDGKDDITIYRDGATAGGLSFFFILQSSNGVVRFQPWGVTADQAVSRDYDGDGKTDVAVFRRGATAGAPAFFHILQSTTGTLRSVQWGTTGIVVAGDTPIPDDFDGDGKFDVAVYRFGGLTPNNTFLILRSSDGGFVAQPFGNYGFDYIVPGDYDGDGKGDYAVARTGATASAPVTWYILQSLTGVLRAQQFGITSDRMIQADYDGDARIDIAVYRTAAGGNIHYAVGSLLNALMAQLWGLPGDFPTATYNAR